MKSPIVSHSDVRIKTGKISVTETALRLSGID